MCTILDYGLDSPARALLVLVLFMDDRQGQKAMNKLHFQKALRYFEHLQQEKEIDFSNFKYGGVSFELQENLEVLEEIGLVAKVGGKYVLTKEGEEIAKELVPHYDEETLRKLRYAKHHLNDLTDRELLFFMYMTLPETRAHSIEFEKLKAEAENLTRKLFVKGRINARTAAEWLGIDEKEFLNSLAACGQ